MTKTPKIEELSKLRYSSFQTHEGYVGAIVLQPLGHYCGYVGVPPGHPAYGGDYTSDEDIYFLEVHGGVTYSGEQNEENGNYPTQDPEYDGRWFIGFDAAHAYDLPNPSRVIESDEFTEEEKKRAYHYGKAMLDSVEKMREEVAEETTFKDYGFILREVFSLSEQLKHLEDQAEGVL